MKLTIHQDLKFSETEITVSCAAVDSRLERLIRLIRQHSFSLTGYADGCEYQLAAEQICYIESVDGKTFFYLEKEVYSAKKRLPFWNSCFPAQPLRASAKAASLIRTF